MHQSESKTRIQTSGKRHGALAKAQQQQQRVDRLKSSSSTSSMNVQVSFRFLFVSWITIIVSSFLLGRSVRSILHPTTTTTSNNNPSEFQQDESPIQLPFPTAVHGKFIPQTVYTSKVIDTIWSLSSDTVHAHRPLSHHDDNQWRDCGSEASKAGECMAISPGTAAAAAMGAIQNISNNNNNNNNNIVIIDSHEVYLPAGQHVIADIQNVDSVFLNSKERLAQAMIDVVKLGGLTMLSYHCHSLVPNGISCIAVLLESHISFHTWPNHGVILLDLFTCGASGLIPLIPVIKQLFGIPRQPSSMYGETTVDPPHMVWAHKLRGFRPDGDDNPLLNDLGRSLGVLELELKETVASVESPYHTYDIYDFIEPRFSSVESYERSLAQDGSYESMHPELHRPNRVLFLDGYMQLQRKGETEYHEALVHPAMFTHTHPQRVAIIGGGEGATLREVLKHNTVQQVVMLELDEKLVNLSRTHLVEWNDCSDLIGSAPCCFDDPRATVYHQDALQWFKQLYLDGDEKTRFDVIIMEALDPEVGVDFSDSLYNNTSFFRALYNALSDDGILVVQTGQAPTLKGPAESLSRNQKRAMTIRDISYQGFQSIHSYEESHAGFHEVWTYVAALKSFKSRRFWFARESEVELAIHKRSMRTWSNNSPFKYFDGSTMLSYQLPSKSAQVVYCREEESQMMMLGSCESSGGHGGGFDPDRPLAPVSSFQVTTSSLIAKGAGRGVFAKEPIPQGAYIALDDAVNKLYFPPSTYWTIDDLIDEHEAFEALKTFDYYMHGYGFQGAFFGDADVNVDAGIVTFENHGCNGTYNIGKTSLHTEMTLSLETSMPMEFHQGTSSHENSPYNPFAERNMARYFHQGNVALRDIQSGEEILTNYLFYTTNSSDWHDDVVRLREICTGRLVGEVAEYEALSSSSNNSV